MEKIKSVDYEEEMGQSYVDYAMSVITERALPDVKDGLKPVQRRILYTLSSLTKPDAPHRKCARIVGDAMGKYHPHGDASIYEGLVNLAQSWKLPIPLVDPHGNFGDLSGSGAAAMRYTEARISAYAEEGMKDLKYCEFVPNFDGTEKEPVHIPFLVPNVLTGGATGIAVGMATNIPTHNFGEVCDAEIAYLQNPDISLEDLCQIVKGPDFATGGIINTTKDNLLEIYRTGLGKLRVRGKVEVRDAGRGRKSICITEIPFTMIGSTEKFLNTVAELARTGKLPQVVDIADRGDKDGECLCIDVKKGTTDEEIEKIINILYKKAGLEDTYGVNINCIYNKKPEVMGLKRILETYTEYKEEVYHAKYTALLAEQEEQREIKTGLLAAVDVIDLIIEVLRGAKNTKDAKECLMYGKTENIKFRYKGSEADAKQLSFTEKQTDAILAMRLQKLIGLEIDQLKKELDETEKLLKKYNKLLSSDKEMKKQMIADIEDVKKRYAIPRRTLIRNLGEVTVEKETEQEVDYVVLLDRFFYLKAVPKPIFEKNKDIAHKIKVECTNLDRLAVFDSDGQLHTMKVGDLIKKQLKKDKKFRISDKGIQIFEFCQMNENANVLCMITEKQLTEGEVVVASEDGKGKRVAGSAFPMTRKCSQASKKPLIFAAPAQAYLVIVTEAGNVLKIRTADIPEQGKGAGGVTLISLKKGDKIRMMETGGRDAEIGGVPYGDINTGIRGGRGSRIKLTFPAEEG